MPLYAMCRDIFGGVPLKNNFDQTIYFSDFEVLPNEPLMFFLLKQVVNTTSEELTNVSIEASVWDLQGECPYYKVFDNLSIPPKKTLPIAEMKYPKSKNPKPVYFLLLKFYNSSDYSILSRNFYWLHLNGGDYTMLETYRKKKIPLKITSNTIIKGDTYELQMHVENKSRKTLSKCFTDANFNGDLEKNHEDGYFLGKLYRKCFSKKDSLKMMEINGDDVGVAFFLQFSVHGAKKEHKEGEDTRILPVHYSDNYFSLVPGEGISVNLSFEVQPGVTPRVSLHGWNYHTGGHTVY